MMQRTCVRRGLQRLPDGEIFTKAIAESRVIVTFDLDFGEILALAKGRKAGVILFRLRNTSAPGSGMTIDLFIDWPALSTHQSQNVTFTFSQLRKYETIGGRG
jgi:predicted nuclease of predicted toxin-antitoxin system